MRHVKIAFLVLSLGIMFGISAVAVADISTSIDTTISDTTVKLVDTTVIIPKLDFSNIKLFDALTALSRAYNLSIYIDTSVVGSINMRLENVSLNDALMFIIKEYNLAWERTGQILKIYLPKTPPPPEEPLDIIYTNNRLTFDIKKIKLDRFVTELTNLTQRNIIIENNTNGYISGKITDLDFNKALKVILSSNGFTYKVLDEIIYIGKETSEQSPSMTRNLNLSCENGVLTMDIANQSLGDVISVISEECNIDIFVQTKLEGNITASLKDKNIEETLTYLLMNSNFSFKEMEGIYFIGDKNSEDIFDTELIRLKHLIAANVESVIPISLSKQITIKVVTEHNGLVITGPRTAIAKLESFIKEIDIPMAQVLFDVLVVDFNTTDMTNFGISANNFGGANGLPGQTYFPEINISAEGKDMNNNLRSIERHLGISKLGTLDDNFFIQLNMLQKEDKVKIKSRPKIAALNGHPASIKIGTSQYYLLESKIVHPSQQTSVSTQTSQRFEVIEADMSLEVTPYVNESDELIVEVKPEFNTPSSAFDPDVPPTINKRVLNSTVRLKNGETIVLGGLVQNTKSENIEKLPILGSIPIIGRLFQNRTTTENKSELMIYITPHIYYGSEGSVNLDSLIIKK